MTNQSSNDTTNLSRQIHNAARDGECLKLEVLLSKSEEKTALLSQHIKENKESTTPLLIAARNGREQVVRFLLTKFKVNVEQTGVLIFDQATTKGATALWAAAKAGWLDVVVTLLEFKANVNHKTIRHSTPLRAACWGGHFEVVKVLIENKADVEAKYVDGNTCLMVACFCGHIDVVHHLLVHEANPNTRCDFGNTSLHYAVRRGILDIVKMLIKFGAEVVPNQELITPIHLAAQFCYSDIIDYLVSRPNCTRLQKVNAFEFLGATYSNHPVWQDLEKCYYYLLLAMKERYGDPSNVLNKTILPPLEAYENRQECTSISEFENIKDDPHSLQMEALMIKERLLGERILDVANGMIFSGAMFADNGNYRNCILLWIRALKLKYKINELVSKDFVNFCELFSQMLILGVEVNYKFVLEVFEMCLQEIKKRSLRDNNTDEIQEGLSSTTPSIIHIALYLLTILTKCYSRCSEDELFEIYKKVYRFNCLNLTIETKNKQTPLHMICDGEAVTGIKSSEIKAIVKFPNVEVIALLLKCGADANSLDEYKNTPLHILSLSYNSTILDDSINLLLEYNCHIDRVNRFGNTAFDIASTIAAQILKIKNGKKSLKCIAAKAVKHYRLSYKGIIPWDLEEFVDFH